MRIWTYIITVLLGNGSFHTNTDIEAVRKNYSMAVLDKNVCRTMIGELLSDRANTTSMAYLGGFQAIWARHVANPISNLKTFYAGKANIEEALRQDSKNPEIRFIRLSVQENCPFFLSYHSNIQEDRSFLKLNMHKIKSPMLSEMISSLLKDKR